MKRLLQFVSAENPFQKNIGMGVLVHFPRMEESIILGERLKAKPDKLSLPQLACDFMGAVAQPTYITPKLIYCFVFRLRQKNKNVPP